MAENVINWVWGHSRAINGSLIVMLAIAHEADGDGITAMSVLELAQKTRLSERSVQNATTDLRRSGELAIQPKGGSHGRNGYRVIMTEQISRGADIAPLPPGSPAESAPLDVRRGAISAPPQNLHPAESAPLHAYPPSSEPDPAESAPLAISDVFIGSTGRSTAEVKDVPAKPPRPDVDRLCEHLASRIEANGSKRPAITQKWRDAARLMLDKDGRTEEQATAAIDWCQDDEFWRANILSMPKLREKYEQLRLQAARSRKPAREERKTGILQRAMQRAEMREVNDANGNGHPGGVRQRMLPPAGDG